MHKFEHITLEALEASKKGQELLTCQNQAENIYLTMSIKETKDLNQRFFLDIQKNISDKLMGNLLDYFKDEGSLFDKKDFRRY